MDACPPFALDSSGLPVTVWRGESGGTLFAEFDAARTRHGLFFFAEDKRQADFYAGCGTQARAFRLRAARVLDLVDMWKPATLHEVTGFLEAFRGEYDEWIDRASGEPLDVGTCIESGSLYDYEGNGSGGRWNHLFRFARACGYDGVRVTDATDGVCAPVWVVFEPGQIEAVAGPGPGVAAQPLPDKRRRRLARS